MGLNELDKRMNSRRIEGGVLWLLLLCAALMFHSIQNSVQKESLSMSSSVVLEPFDKIMFYKNETGLFEVFLPGMINGQRIQVNLLVSKGSVDLKCLDRSNREVPVSEHVGFSGSRFAIQNDADYRLILDAKNADFTFTVTVLDDSIIL